MDKRWNHRKIPGPVICDVIRQVMPKNRTFTMTEIFKLVKAALPRPASEATIRAEFYDLRRSGEVRLVSRGYRGIVQWAVSDGRVRPVPMAALRLVDVAEALIRDSGPMTTLALCVEFHNLGFRENVAPASLIATLRVCMRHSHRLVCLGDDRWGLA